MCVKIKQIVKWKIMNIYNMYLSIIELLSSYYK